jgi:hypothetical protein
MALKPVYVTADELRQHFNSQGFTEKIRIGAVSVRIEKEWAAPPHLGFPEGTKSQRVAYIGGNGQLVAVVHQYRRPDGSLAASGLPDPKRVVVGDVLYILEL